MVTSAGGSLSNRQQPWTGVECPACGVIGKLCRAQNGVEVGPPAGAHLSERWAKRLEQQLFAARFSSRAATFRHDCSSPPWQHTTPSPKTWQRRASRPSCPATAMVSSRRMTTSSTTPWSTSTLACVSGIWVGFAARELTHTDDGVKRGMEQRHLQMYALAGTLGTGLFLTSGKAISHGGPAGALLAYITMGAIIFSMSGYWLQPFVWATLTPPRRLSR